mmetsp:Transcript_18871/g.23751  ORF Transcript_18871/g.23751 Transcript_18871/m.23751 type:complete len:742 (+) Transcript_18871:80-2305(+)
MSNSPRIISLDEGWNNEIKSKAIDKLEDMLSNGLDKKTSKLFAPRDYVQTYTTCYNMCTQRSPYNWSEQLYQRHGETIGNYLTGTVLPALRDKHNEYLLRELTRRWGNHKIMNQWMQKFFMYLDRYYVKHHSLPTLTEAGLQNFKDLVYDAVKKDVVNAMLSIIDLERDGKIIDRTLIKDCVELFEAMGMGTLDAYNADFEEALLSSSQEFYARKSQEWIESDSTPDYMIKAERALEEERQRVTNYLNPSTESKLLRVVDQELLEKCELTLLEKEGSGCRVLLANNKSEHLARMYRLFSRVPEGLQPMANIVQSFIESMGNEIINRREAKIDAGEKENNQDPAFVKELLALHDKYMQVVTEQFSGNSLFQKALKEAFVEFVNRDVGKTKNADLMSSFCDRILKTGGEKLSDEQVEEYLEKVVQLFSYLTDKDLFAEIYRSQLAKRLLNQRSASDDAERLMIGKLKLRCGSQFTGKMEGMMNDLAIGSDHQSDFEKHLKDKDFNLNRVEFSVQVLTTGYWPTYKSFDVNLPPEMIRCTQVFKDYHDEKTSHRRLAWMHSLGNATLRANFGKKFYDVQVSTLQAVVLGLFNNEDLLSFGAIQERTNLPEEVVKRVMHSLSCGKFKMVKKTSDGNSIKPTDEFRYNQSFSCPMRKIRIPMASLDQSHNPKRVEEDRSIAIEAAVVRIMKARKTLSHQQLLAEVLSQLSFFRPNPKVIKRRIEALIDREYLERDPETPNTYRYLA